MSVRYDKEMETALYVIEQIECIELFLIMDGEPIESLWVKAKMQTKNMWLFNEYISTGIPTRKNK